MDEDEAWESLYELYERGDIDHVPVIGKDPEPHFTMTEQGMENARELLREKDEAVLSLVNVAVGDVDRPGDPRNVAEALVRLGATLRDDAGINLFQVLRRHEEIVPIDLAELPDEFFAEFDPEDDA